MSVGNNFGCLISYRMISDWVEVFFYVQWSDDRGSRVVPMLYPTMTFTITFTVASTITISVQLAMVGRFL